MFSKADIEKYFVGEKQESFWFIVIGITAVVVAIILFFVIKTSFYKGFALPFFIIGIILGIVGYNVHKRSDADRSNNVYAYDMNPAQLKDKELPRMEKVMKNFVVIRYVEIVLLIAGAVLYFYFLRDITKDFWRGFGLALAIMALIALLADAVAESRGRKYVQGLRAFVGEAASF